MNYEEERMKKLETEFREFIDDKWLWNPLAFFDKFSIDFIRQIKDKLWLEGGAIRTSIRNRGEKFYEEIYGKDSK